MKYHEKTYIATIEAGGIRLEDGSIQRTLSGATKIITGWPTANGWKHWCQDKECKKPLDLLRRNK